jgi:hypothetical protein
MFNAIGTNVSTLDDVDVVVGPADGVVGVENMVLAFTWSQRYKTFYVCNF